MVACHLLVEIYIISDGNMINGCSHTTGHCNVVKQACYCTCTNDDYIIISNIRSLMSIRGDTFQEIMSIHYITSLT